MEPSITRQQAHTPIKFGLAASLVSHTFMIQLVERGASHGLTIRSSRARFAASCKF